MGNLPAFRSVARFIGEGFAKSSQQLVSSTTLSLMHSARAIGISIPKVERDDGMVQRSTQRSCRMVCLIRSSRVRRITGGLGRINECLKIILTTLL